MSTPCDVIIRQATKDDYQSVMDIDNDVYSGMDYLPATYQDFLKEKKCDMLLAEKHGTVVGFAIFEMVSKNAMVTMAARTHTSYRRQGIATKLYKEGIARYIKEHGSPLYEIRVTLPSRNMVENWKENHPNWQLERKWNVLHYRMMANNLSALWQCPSNNIALESTSAELLNDKTLSQLEDIIRSEGNLFATDFTWKPMLANKKSIAQALEKCDLVLLTKHKNDLSESNIVAFSLTFKFDVKIGVALEIWFFAEEFQLDICAAHVSTSLRKFIGRSNATMSIGLNLHVPLKFEPVLVEDKLHPLIGKRNGEAVFWKEHVAVLYTETHTEEKTDK